MGEGPGHRAVRAKAQEEQARTQAAAVALLWRFAIREPCWKGLVGTVMCILDSNLLWSITGIALSAEMVMRTYKVLTWDGVKGRLENAEDYCRRRGHTLEKRISRRLTGEAQKSWGESPFVDLDLRGQEARATHARLQAEGCVLLAVGIALTMT